ncbi:MULTISPECIES: helix-turn-helix domain-containing protein [unclassified Spirosoma]|uniref:helix-turn-helix domain-containing protein n=1 Tax=unclassified Spirosoma TaxID=2621999 RepID=UPI00096267D1|nr:MULTISPECIES: helix-turn-helix domain-containing protein [unclassified Spirosoma]MBN8825901.1 helix-turn-helix domain-containing protein [Spirosoma sp.]OJW70587.1 MAG: AraC family transcriptional regulator [Spirosoma sp. 48-14]
MNRQGLKNYKGLYGDHRLPFPENFIHHELLAVRSKLYGWEIDQHLHTDLYQLFIFTEGSGIVLSEQRRVTLRPPCVLMVPANTLHGFAFQAGMDGEVFTLSESSLDKLLRDSQHIRLGLSQLQQVTFEDSGVSFNDIHWLKDRIIRELETDQPEKQGILEHLTQLLLISLYRTSLRSEAPAPKSDNRTLTYFLSFQKLIRQSVHEPKSIQQYARELHITTVHLNRICQSIVNKSALQLVHDYLTAEAKKYLLNTSCSLSEVSYLLNFKDPAYFSRLFKKQTGLSPRDFRKQQGIL